MVAGVRAALAAALLIAVPTAPAAAQSRSTAALPAPASLKPGQFVWYEQPQMIKASIAEQGSVAIVVSILDQLAYVYRDGRLLAVTTVSTGSGGHETPTGAFTILQKKVFHRSNLYSNAPMPYMQRLTWTGIALHAGHLPGYPASHGCIRLPKEFARQLYDMTELGGTVRVVETYDDPSIYAPLAPEPMIAAPMLTAQTRDFAGAHDAVFASAASGPGSSAPLLAAETRNLGNGAFDVVTMPVEQLRTRSRPASWVTGPAREPGQPIPSGK